MFCGEGSSSERVLYSQHHRDATNTFCHRMGQRVCMDVREDERICVLALHITDRSPHNFCSCWVFTPYWNIRRCRFLCNILSEDDLSGNKNLKPAVRTELNERVKLRRFSLESDTSWYKLHEGSNLWNSMDAQGFKCYSW